MKEVTPLPPDGNRNQDSVAAPKRKRWIAGKVVTPIGHVPRVSTRLDITDILGSVRVRTGLRRMSYLVEPGLYAVGSPTAESPVFVSANYKLSFDNLRRELCGVDGWIMVIDTKGINVWCAAGKGTFGTQEIVHRIEVTRLREIISHRQIIVPQLGASGVAAHEVRRQSSFRVIYGPVRARDIRRFLKSGMKASPDMRHVQFNLADRAVLIPLELVNWGRYAVLAAIAFLLLSGLSRGGYVLFDPSGWRQALLLIVAFLAGCVFVPLLLPWLPGRAFSWKGVTVGLAAWLVLLVSGVIPSAQLTGHFEAAAWALLMTAVGAFMALNFTGSTTYTSLSGVRKEMRLAIPLQIATAALGLAIWVAARYL
jgi:hypothetical protein